MPSFYGMISDLVSRYYIYIVAIVVIVIFGWLARRLYGQHIQKKLDDKNFGDIANANTNGKELPIYFFHVDWCPHCKTAMPEWRGFRDSYHNKQKMGYNIRCIDINCTAEDEETQANLNKFGIDSFPTIKMVKDEEQIDFDARITSDNLENFLDTMIGS